MSDSIPTHRVTTNHSDSFSVVVPDSALKVRHLEQPRYSLCCHCNLQFSKGTVVIVPVFLRKCKNRLARHSSRSMKGSALPFPNEVIAHAEGVGLNRQGGIESAKGWQDASINHEDVIHIMQLAVAAYH